MNFPSHILFNNVNHGYRAAILKKNSLWLLLLYMAVATYFYYEKVRRTMCTAIVSYIIKEVFLKNLSQMLSVELLQLTDYYFLKMAFSFT